jgi:hypothetical protein
MIQYISNIIPRLKEYSATLDKKEIFVDVPWVIIDADLNQQKYIFRRDGDLVMSLNGQVTIGKWEYLSAAKSLLINRVRDKILLNQYFIDPAIMILKKDGLTNDYFIMANEILMPDLNTNAYIRNLYYKKNKITTQKLKTGEFLELSIQDEFSLNHHVTIEGEPVPDCKLELYDSATRYLVKNSRIIKVLVEELYSTDKGMIRIEHQVGFSPNIGDLVIQFNELAKDGKYRLGFMNHIWVENGRIIKT